jgi:hypothetical protein
MFVNCEIASVLDECGIPREISVRIPIKIFGTYLEAELSIYSREYKGSKHTRWKIRI